MRFDRIGAALIVVMAAALTASAQPVLITAPATIGPLDTTITPTAGGAPVALATAEITVEGATLTINGRHAIASLSVVRNGANQPGVVTHTSGFTFDYSGVGSDLVMGMHLTTTGGVFVQGAEVGLVESRIDAAGRGYLSATGPGAGTSALRAGGAGHGGTGSDSSQGDVGGGTYGSFENPTEMGSGGGHDTSTGSSVSDGGPGGGVLHLTVGGTLTVDGLISANGLGNLVGGWDAGAGSGGSIRIDTGALAGTGLITANGGPGGTTVAGAGGGGRVAVYAGSSTMSDLSIRAHGGSHALPGAAGTVYAKLSSGATPTLIIDNGDLPYVNAITEMTGEVEVPGDLRIRNNGRLGPVRQDASLDLAVLGDVTVESDGLVFADGRGYLSATGPGAGTSALRAGGAGHGGAGSDSSQGDVGGGTYGSFENPTEMGSGGGHDTSTGSSVSDGGPGGGVLHLTVGGTLTVDGLISANGLGNLVGGWDAGAGSGGSIRIDTGALAGTGLITANGGPGGTTVAGAGGGGRVAVYAGSSTMSDLSIRAHGGSHALPGAAGTVYAKLSSGATPTLIIDNGDIPYVNAITEMTGEVEVPGDLRIRNNGRLGPERQDASLDLAVLGDVTVESDGLVFADGRGYLSATGPGAGTSALRAGGAGHGGAGSDSSQGDVGGGTYGSFENPTEMGSGGGHDTSTSSSTSDGGPGGGVLHLTVGGTLTVDGLISANGLGNLVGGWDAGAGSGGSIRIDTGALAGTGLITANGGPGGTTVAGAGGGGRVAVYAGSSTLSDLSIRAHGGSHALPGAAGTVYAKLSSGATPTLIIDNGDIPYVNAITEMTGEVEVPGDLRIRNNGRLGPVRRNDTFELFVVGDAVIESDGRVFADGRGHVSQSGPGAGAGGSSGGGAGHGGRGGASSTGAAGGTTYGSEAAPVQMGSGGGRDTGTSTSTSDGGPGGGVIQLIVLGELVVDGTISANGLGNLVGGWDAGGGSGGSLLISAGTLSGSGAISASGGPGGTSSAGCGAGGRVALYVCSFDMMVSQIAVSGNVGPRPGEDGTVFFGALAIGPDEVRACDRSEVTLSVVAQAGGASSGYQWQIEGIDLVDGVTPFGSVITGSSTDTLTISGITVFDIGLYTCISDGLCGIAESNAVFVSVCPSDYNCDGITDILDFLDFFQDFSACEQQGGPCGDLGNSDINGDTIVDILDFLDFLQYFSEGC